ncbi:hypothetical protein MJO28_002473 [Puccinia striiformis f. sp. tritici]|uniref:Uncharacterized protein n=1 Tax=Puccinia striiformis f. sp. tritici TaxID=168172 RepID=A0ACC0EQF0_9BASI|nr:hypothetical protein MJO28_002473 [Puccinia striiformis f. sp. tritici]KAI9628564.1 hypothetical protein KEM48_011520 [Puccinia striiformis f. sp. tritici PST-130]
MIQTATNLRVVMAYGGLPLEVREREAQIFNQGAIAEDEGGYKLRVIFHSLHEWDGQEEVAANALKI